MTETADLKLQHYRAGDAPTAENNRLWPLFGAGWENLGVDGGPIDTPMPTPGPDELLVRHDAVGICFSDVKVLRAGNKHPRIYRNMQEKPVVLGHEVALTVVEVGATLRDQYQPGDRFIIQADIYINGKSYAYGYEIEGGFERYAIVDQRVLNGDHGNYLLPVKPATGYAEVALCEPWACVEASYTVNYRTRWQDDGVVWLVGNGAGVKLGQAESWRPRKVVLGMADSAFADQVRAWAQAQGIEVVDADDGVTAYDDIVVLGGDGALCEQVFGRLANGGVFNLVLDQPLDRPVAVDIGRMHYDHLAVVGTATADLSAAYQPVRTQLKAGGNTLLLGVAGPMGQMHLMRALALPGKPAKIVATDLFSARMEPVKRRFIPTAAANGVGLVCISRDELDSDATFLGREQEEGGARGYDDIVVLAPFASVVEQAWPFAADNCVINVFAGLSRGTIARINLDDVARRGCHCRHRRRRRWAACCGRRALCRQGRHLSELEQAPAGDAAGRPGARFAFGLRQTGRERHVDA